jgi:transposase-like protein
MSVAVREAGSVACVALARNIADAAQQESAHTGRVCRLRDTVAVEAFLRALSAGCSQTTAARRSGLSEGAIRRWLRLASDGTSGGVYAQFKAAIHAVAEQRQIARLQSVVVGNVTPPARSEPQLVIPPAEPAIDPSTVWSWHLRLDRAARCAVADEATRLRTDVAVEMWAMKVFTLPPRPPLLLARDVSFDRVTQLYVEWVAKTFQEAPTEGTIDTLAWAWYLQHRAPA